MTFVVLTELLIFKPTSETMTTAWLRIKCILNQKVLIFFLFLHEIILLRVPLKHLSIGLLMSIAQHQGPVVQN